jgi:hypothetical protein
MDSEHQCGECGGEADYVMTCGIELCDRCTHTHELKYQCEVWCELE